MNLAISCVMATGTDTCHGNRYKRPQGAKGVQHYGNINDNGKTVQRVLTKEY